VPARQRGDFFGEALRGTANGTCIDVEAPSATSHGNLLTGFCGPLELNGGGADTGALGNAKLLPKVFVADGVTPIPGGKVSVVDGLDEMVSVATQNWRASASLRH